MSGNQEIASGVNSIGQGVGAFYQASALRAQAGGYRAEAELYKEAAAVEVSSTNIQEFQTQRQATKAMGSQEAEIAAAGFTTSGSSLDILRESTQQANMAKAVVAQQGLIQEEAYKAQETAANAAAKAARASASGLSIMGGIDIFNGIGQIAAGIASNVYAGGMA